MKKILYLLSVIFMLLIIPIHCQAEAHQGCIYVNGQWYTNHYDAYIASINAPNNNKYARVFIDGYKVKETAILVEKIINFFQKEYGLTLKKDVSVYVAKNIKEYREKIKFYEYHQMNASNNTYALSFESPLTNTIYINYEACGKRFPFTLSHEITHIYQYLYYPEKVQNEDYMILEGKADIMASKITGYPVKIIDHGIPYETIKTRENRIKIMEKQGVETVKEQERFYASQTPGFFL